MKINTSKWLNWRESRGELSCGSFTELRCTPKSKLLPWSVFLGTDIDVYDDIYRCIHFMDAVRFGCFAEMDDKRYEG